MQLIQLRRARQGCLAMQGTGTGKPQQWMARVVMLWFGLPCSILLIFGAAVLLLSLTCQL